MTTYRIEKRANYTVVDNAFIKDDRLSFKAKGILLYLLSRPDNWNVYESDIIAQSNDGRRAVRSGIQELIEIGYIERQQKRDGKNQFAGYENVVREQTLAQSPLSRFATTENAITENAITENSTLVNTDLSSTEEVKEYNNSPPPKAASQSVFSRLTKEYDPSCIRIALELVDRHIDKIYPSITGKVHDNLSKAHRMSFVEKIIEFQDTLFLTPDELNSFWDYMTQRINCKKCDPTIFYITAPTVLGYWAMNHGEYGFDAVRGTIYCPVEECY